MRRPTTTTLMGTKKKSIENVWDAKARYALKTPSKAFIFGTSIPVQLTMVPLLKGLRLGEIQMTLSEAQDYRHQDKNIRFGREVTRLSFQVDEALRVLDDQGQEGWLIERNMTLPTSLARCLQDVDALGIKVRHRLLLVIQLLNPDGHSSEVPTPLSLFLSPSLPPLIESECGRSAPSFRFGSSSPPP